MVYQHFQRIMEMLTLKYSYVWYVRELTDINVADVQFIVVFLIINVLKEVIYGLHTKPSF